MNSEGLVYDGSGSLTSVLAGYVHNLPSGLMDGERDSKSLKYMLNELKRSCLIGVSTMRNVFTEKVIGRMCESNESSVR